MCPLFQAKIVCSGTEIHWQDWIIPIGILHTVLTVQLSKVEKRDRLFIYLIILLMKAKAGQIMGAIKVSKV